MKPASEASKASQTSGLVPAADPWGWWYGMAPVSLIDPDRQGDHAHSQRKFG